MNLINANAVRQAALNFGVIFESSQIDEIVDKVNRWADWQLKFFPIRHYGTNQFQIEVARRRLAALDAFLSAFDVHDFDRREDYYGLAMEVLEGQIDQRAAISMQQRDEIFGIFVNIRLNTKQWIDSLEKSSRKVTATVNKPRAKLLFIFLSLGDSIINREIAATIAALIFENLKKTIKKSADTESKDALKFLISVVIGLQDCRSRSFTDAWRLSMRSRPSNILF